MINKKNVLILGAGVSGLSTGILLLQNGFKATIWAKELPPYTTSNKAAAVWYPFICGPKEKATAWARDTINHFKNDVPFSVSGCKKTTVVEVFNKKAPEPWWKDSVDAYQRISKKKLPKNYVDGYEVEGIVMDTDKYMDYLVATFKKLGGKLIKKEITNIKEAFTKYKLVVNCTGLGSHTLFNDKTVYPVRGQIIKIKPNGFDYSLFEQEGPHSLAYIIPRLKDIVLGGTAQEHNWNLTIDPKDTTEILKKCANILPAFKDVVIDEIKVGLRPYRKNIRLEIEKFSDNFVVHNYGHGGAGFTLSWGCAKNTVGLLNSL